MALAAAQGLSGAGDVVNVLEFRLKQPERAGEIAERVQQAAGPGFSATTWMEENRALFGKCNNPNWHGHNYTLDIFVSGEVDDKTGYVIDLARLKAIVQREVVDKVDHRNLNLEVDFMRGIIPTTENIVVAMWRAIEPHVVPGRLSRLVLWETPNNYVEYEGK